MSDGIDRRRFLKVLGVTGGGAAVLSGCSTGNAEKLIPYLVPPNDQIPGNATYYASTCRECAAGCGIQVRVREGRAVKVEGNPEAPVNAGRLCARAQASLQGTYNPDRLRGPMARNAAGGFDPITWDEAISRVATALNGAGDKTWFVSGNEAGTFDRLITEWLRAFGSTRRVVYEPFGYEALRRANRDVFGSDTVPSINFANARYVLSFGVDFLETWLSPVEYAGSFTASHAFQKGAMGRYVHVEPRMSMTGMSADEWIAPVPGSEGLLALSIAQVILRDRLGQTPGDAGRLRSMLDKYEPSAVTQRCGVPVATIERLAKEFTAQPSVALAGGMGGQHDDAHDTAAAVALLNYVAGNIGRSVDFGAALNLTDGGYRGLAELTSAMQGGQVGVLFVHGANPAYASPQALGFAAAMAKVPVKVSFARCFDETAMLADLILPDHDPMEQWNDYEPRAGVHMLLQPVMEPVFDTRQTGDVLLQVAKKAGGTPAQRLSAATYKDYLQAQWAGVQRAMGDRREFAEFWMTALQHGGVWSETRAAGARLSAGASRLNGNGWSAPEGRFTLIAYPSPVFFDGRAANRPWLQELPDPVTKVTWSSWVEMHPDTAMRLGIAEGDILEVTSDAGSIRAPAYLYPGIRTDVIAMPLGQGHTAYGRYAKGTGANAYALLPAAATQFGGVGHYVAVSIRNTGEHEKLAKTEGYNRDMGRGIVQGVTLAAITAKGAHAEYPEGAAPMGEHVEDVLKHRAEEQHQDTERGNYLGDHPRWAMTIDLSKCTGCSACVTACYSENNIPYVGKAQVQRGREMSWMRIERYYEGGTDGEPLEARFLPMLCQQCGNAPCEPVCPVFAAYHTPDGLNGQVYNRCVGTRYCSNNCPYKVRYFNWFDYQNVADPAFAWPEPMNWMLNPDVTVRSKGVMEKCTFCVQRIRGAQHQARLMNTPLKDGDIQTACQQTCPTGAIVFGDIKDTESRVTIQSADQRGYKVLEGLNTKPAVTYLMKVRNAVEA